MHMGLATKDLCHAIVLRKPAASGSVIAEIQLAFGVMNTLLFACPCCHHTDFCPFAAAEIGSVAMQVTILRINMSADRHEHGSTWRKTTAHAQVSTSGHSHTPLQPPLPPYCRLGHLLPVPPLCLVLSIVNLRGINTAVIPSCHANVLVKVVCWVVGTAP
jgi:hypothetical protein